MQMDDAELLQSYRFALRELRMLENQRDDLEDLLQRDHYGRRCRTSEAINRQLAACRAALEERRSGLERIVEGFEDALSRVSDPRTRLILRQYYGLGLTDAQAAEGARMSTRLANKLRNDYLRRQAAKRRLS